MWRYKVSPHISGILRLAESLTECPKLWDGTDVMKNFDIENPKHLFALRQHAVQHSEQCGECVVLLGLQDLVAEVDAWHPHVERWSWHWWHAHQLQSEMNQMWANPSAGCLYCCMDFQAPTPAKICAKHSKINSIT